MNTKHIRRYCVGLLLFVVVYGMVACAPAHTPTPTHTPQRATVRTMTSTAATRMPTRIPAIVSPRAPSPTPTLLPGWAGESLSKPDSAGYTEKIAMTADHRGALHVVLVTKEGGNYKGIYHLSYETKGPEISAAWSKPAEIVKASFSDKRYMNLAIAVDSHNVPHVLWTMEDKILYSGQRADGSWSPPSVVVPAVCPNCLQLEPPVIAINAMDEVHVLWSDQQMIRWSSKLPKGEWSPPIEIAAGNGPSASVDRNNMLHVTWSQGSNVMYTFKPRDGSWADPIVISDKFTESPVIAIDSANTVHIVWYARIRSRPEFWYAYKPLNGTWTRRKPIPVSTLGQSPSYALALVGSDDLILMWREPGSDDAISYITKQGKDFWSDLTNIPQTEQVPYTFAGDPDGNVHLIWETRAKIGQVQYLAHAATPIRNIAQSPISVVEPTPLPGLVEFPISTGPGTRGGLDISGNIVVWNEKGKKDWDILGHDLAARSQFTITTREGDQLSPAISGNIAVWGDYQKARIYAYDLSAKQEFLVTAQSSPQFAPDISGNIVVFRDWRKTGTCGWGGSPEFGMAPSCDWDVWGVDLEKKMEFPIRTTTAVQSSPRIMGDTIFWTETSGGKSAMFSYQLGTASQPVQIASVPSAKDGNIQVEASRHGNVAGLFGYHLPTGNEFPIALGPGVTSDADISSNIVVWADTRSGDADIYGYDLASGKEFLICAAPGDQVNPTLDGDVVVWVDKRNSYTEIYGARLPSLDKKQTDKPVPAPTPTPTVTPTPTPTPIVPEIKLLSPANKSTVDTLIPTVRFDVGREKPDSHLLWGFIGGGGETKGGWNCSKEQDTSIVQCVPENNLKPATTYTWRAEAHYAECTGSNCAVRSEEWSFTTPSGPITPPPAPTLISPPNGATIELGNLRFQWNPVEGAVQYQYGWKEADYSGDQWESRGYRKDAPHGDVGMTTSGFVRGKMYRWGVRARTAYAWSEWAEATFTVSAAEPTRPPSPVLLAPADNSVVDTLVPVLRFDLVTRDVDNRSLVSSLFLVEDTGDEPTGVRSFSSRANSNVVEVTLSENLKPGTTYTWRIRSRYHTCSADDCWASSAKWTFTTGSRAFTPLPAPVLISPVGDAVVDSKSVKIEWNTVKGATAYGFGIGSCPRDFGLRVRNPGPTQMTMQTTMELESGQTYCWAVRARDDYAWGEWAEGTFKTAP